MFAGCRKGPIPFVSYGAFRLIDTYDGNTDRMAAPALELDYLIADIVYHPVDLFDHRLREYLHFNSDLNRGYRTSSNEVAAIYYGTFAGNDFAKGSIPAPSCHPRAVCSGRSELDLCA